MIRRVSLISLSGTLAYETDTQTDCEAIVHCNRVFLYAFTQGTRIHYREVTTERVRVLDTAQAVNTNPLPRQLSIQEITQ